MKIGLIGPGIMSIPPVGWGAVEILIWDYYNELIKQNHDVLIINKMRNNTYEQNIPHSNYCKELIQEINNNNFDFVHLHYDCLYHILPFLNCKKIGITSHYPFIDNEYKIINDGFTNIFNFMVNNSKYINFVLAEKDIHFLIQKGANPNLIIKLENGIQSNLFHFSLQPKKACKTIYLGKIDSRKNQYKYQNIDCIEFIGPLSCNQFQPNSSYLGAWSREQLHQNLSEYGNLCLFSNGEADPLVVKEALICGLGVVINETSGKNLEKKEFITFISDDKMNDIDYIKKKIEENRKYSLQNRNTIKEYSRNKYDIEVVCKKYIYKLENT